MKYVPVTVTVMQIVPLAYVAQIGTLGILCQGVLLQRGPTIKQVELIIVSTKR